MDFCLSVKTSFFLYLVFLLNSRLVVAQQQRHDPHYYEENLRQVALDLEKDLTTLVTNASGATTRNPNISKHYATIVHNATREAEKLRTNVQTMLDEAASILAETKTILERTNATTTTTTTGEVPYHDASANLTLGDDLEGTSVNFSISAVKAPVDVVMSSDEVKSALRWSDVALTTNFSESTTFRYFGSRHGFVRVHPGASWLANSPSFDASFEDWYVDGSVLSMDLILLVDASGTMFGLAKKIVEQTVKVLLNLLRAKDRVAAQSFARGPSTLGCSRYLVRPTDDVKAALNDDVSRIYTKGISQYESAFTLASELFANSSALGSSQKVIVLLTDGAHVRNKTFYRNWNKLNTDVRVFTFIVGVPTKDIGSAKLISCENSGYYLRIRSIAAIRQATRDFVAVMGRSAAYHWPDERAAITRSDVGYFIREPVIRLSLPVVRSEEVLGVVGVQVPLREFRRIMPWSWTNSIDVVIADEHGQIIYRQRSSLPDLPDSFVAEMATMQRGRQIVQYRINDLGRVSLQYDYAPLSNWSLSVAIATLPETSRTFAIRRHSTVEDIPEVKAHLDNRRCSSSSNRSELLQNLVDNLTADRCGNEVIEQIIRDADLAFGVYRAWTTTRDDDDDDVCSNFISTQAGVTLYSNRECDIVAHSNDWLSSFDVAVSVESDDKVKAISKLRFDNATFALIGTKFNGTVFKKIVRNAAEKLKATSTFLIDSLGYVVSDSTNSSSPSPPPRFFGHVQPHVVHDAIARGVVTNETVVVKSINRGQCAGETSSNSAFRSTFLGPIFALKAYLVSVVYNLISLGLFSDVRTVLGLSSSSGGDDDVAEYCYIEYAHYFVDLQNDSVSCSTPAECELNYCLVRLGQTNLYVAAVWGDGRDCPNVYALPEERAVPSSSRSRCLEEKRDVYSAQIPVNLTAQKESDFLCSGCRAQGSCVALLLLVVTLLSYL